MFLTIFNHSKKIKKTPYPYQTKTLNTLSLTQKIPYPYITLTKLTITINIQIYINFTLSKYTIFSN